MRKFLLVLSISLLATRLYAAPSNSVSIPNTFVPNTTIQSSQVNDNYNEIQSKYNVHTHTDITSLGTVTTGGWAANIIDTSYGGTGQNFGSVALGSIIYFSNTGVMTTLAPSTIGYPLLTQGAASAPIYSQLGTVGISNLAVTTAKIDSGAVTAAKATALFGSIGGALSNNTDYQATTDGFVVFSSKISNVATNLTAFTDATAHPTAKLFDCANYYGFPLLMPVKKGDYWRVYSDTGSPVIYFSTVGS